MLLWSSVYFEVVYRVNMRPNIRASISVGLKHVAEVVYRVNTWLNIRASSSEGLKHVAEVVYRGNTWPNIRASISVGLKWHACCYEVVYWVALQASNADLHHGQSHLLFLLCTDQKPNSHLSVFAAMTEMRRGYQVVAPWSEVQIKGELKWGSKFLFYFLMKMRKQTKILCNALKQSQQ